MPGCLRPCRMWSSRSKQSAAPFVVYWDMPGPGGLSSPLYFALAIGGACALGEFAGVTRKWDSANNKLNLQRAPNQRSAVARGLISMGMRPNSQNDNRPRQWMRAAQSPWGIDSWAPVRSTCARVDRPRARARASGRRNRPTHVCFQTPPVQFMTS